MSDKPEPFYIVFSPEGDAPPRITHTTHKAAHFAARAMAQLHKGQTFYVMRRAGSPARVDLPAAPEVPGDV